MTDRLPAAALSGVLTSAALLATAGQAQSIHLGPYLQDATPSSIIVSWETTDAAASTVLFGLSPRSLTQTTTGESIASQGSNRIHHTELTGLSPDTTYYYQVQAPGGNSQVLRFRTPPLPSVERSFRFVALSDTQGGPVSNKHTEVINDGIIDFVTETFGPIIENEVAFAIQPGDLVSTGSNYDQWKTQYFDEAQNLYQHIPIYPVPGNHEQDSHWFFDYFELPKNGTQGFEEHWWYKDHGNIRIIGLDSNGGYRVQQQLDWLDTVLADAATNDQIDFVFAQMHHPHLSEAWTPGNTPYTGQIVQRLEAFSSATGKASIHFFGHTHAYSRGQSKEHHHFWVNVAAGEGGIDYWGAFPNEDYDEFARTFVDWGFVLMEVEAGDNPGFRLRRVSRGNEFAPKDNEVLDDITYRVNNTNPATPVPAFPLSSDGPVNPDGFEMRATPFADPDGDAHWESQFQLTTVAGDYSNPAIDEWIRFENWYRPDDAAGASTGYYSVNTVDNPDVTRVDIGEVDPNTTYFWRVRYRDENLGWSDWSVEASFTTGDAVVGGCCLPEGGCVDVREGACGALSGTWNGPASMCADAGCPEFVAVWSQDFESVQLGPNVDEGTNQAQAWTQTPPSGWEVDRSAMPAGGVTEWRGWSFADKDFWITAAGDQGRSQFTRASGTVMVADPDEWDDAPRDAGLFDSTATSPAIDISGVEPNSARFMAFSSWVPDSTQRASMELSFDNGPWQQVFEWHSEQGDNFKPAAYDEVLNIPLDNPAGSQSVRFRFRLYNSGNTWFWALDDVKVVAEITPEKRTQLLFETFEGVALGPSIDETPAATNVWSDTPPFGWSLDDSGVPTVGNADLGVTEWEGWAFADKDWWVGVAGDQRRSEFARGVGAVAIADPDEWDDRGNPRPETLGDYNATIRTPAISIGGMRAGSVEVAFDSSWRPEDTQRAEVRASFDGGTPQTVLEWTSEPGAAFHPDATNERVSFSLNNPANASTLTLSFHMLDARNDWWWAIDNVLVTGVCAADLNADGVLSGADFNAWLTAFSSGDELADQNGDAALTGADFNAFLTNFTIGCD